MFAMALESWNKVILGVDLYVNIHHGTQPVLAGHPSALMAKRVAAFAVADAVPERHDVKVRALEANLALMDNNRNLCGDIFSTPLVKGVFPHPSEVQNIANEYAQVASSLQ
jgi:hypothetical protein